MQGNRTVSGAETIAVRNVGGIDHAVVPFEPGVTLLVGRNATNRTSFLRAVMAAFGSDDVSIKGDADEARVELALGDETYTRRLVRRDGAVVAEGDPYLDDPTLADLFAFLLESNEARRAVAGDADLRALIMRPVDTEAIRSRIDERLAERDRIDDELDELEALKGDLPGLEERRAELEAEIEATHDRLQRAEARLEAAEKSVDESRSERSELEAQLESLRDRRGALDDVRYELETERESLAALREERADLRAERDGLPDLPAGRIEELDARVERLRARKRSLESAVSRLQSLVEFNEQRLDAAADGDLDLDLDGAADADADADAAVTDRLVAGETVTCWTCGSAVERGQIAATVDHLRELSQSKAGRVSELEADVAALTDERDEVARARRERERLDRRLSEIAAEIEATEDEIDRLQERRDALTDEVASIEATVERLEDDEHSEVLELHREANQHEYDLGRLETDLERVTDEIAEIEGRIAEADELERRREAVVEELTELRTRIDRVEADAVSEFNERMDAVLDLLGYDNLDRVWIERVEREVREGRRTVTESAFELHVVRTSRSGSAYEDTVAHLSESEREVTGLVFALAGYLVHDVHEVLPVVLLDSLEAIDADRIADLVAYLETFTDYLLVALLPEDAAALPDAYARVEEI